jgi:hypothetical protein
MWSAKMVRSSIIAPTATFCFRFALAATLCFRTRTYEIGHCHFMLPGAARLSFKAQPARQRSRNGSAVAFDQNSTSSMAVGEGWRGFRRFACVFRKLQAGECLSPKQRHEQSPDVENARLDRSARDEQGCRDRARTGRTRLNTVRLSVSR